MKNIVLIMAAGSGSRMGREKQFIDLGGKPLLSYTIAAFNEHEGIDEIVIITSEKIKKNVEDLVRSFKFSKVISVILGGATRSESVKNGLDSLSGEANVLIHDGARPLVSGALITRVLSALEKNEAVIPAIPLKDTIKEVEAGFVEHTLNRPDYMAVQTPQAFRLSLIKKAFESFNSDLTYFDDAMMIEENLGASIRVVEGDEINIKATTPRDIGFIKYIFSEEKGL